MFLLGSANIGRSAICTPGMEKIAIFYIPDRLICRLIYLITIFSISLWIYCCLWT